LDFAFIACGIMMVIALCVAAIIKPTGILAGQIAGSPLSPLDIEPFIT